MPQVCGPLGRSKSLRPSPYMILQVRSPGSLKSQNAEEESSTPLEVDGELGLKFLGISCYL